MFNKSAQPSGSSKPSGVDMMIQSLLRSMGVQPDVLVIYIEQGKQLATQFVVAMQTTAAKIAAIEVEQKSQRVLLERIAEDRGLINPFGTIAPKQETEHGPGNRS